MQRITNLFSLVLLVLLAACGSANEHISTQELLDDRSTRLEGLIALMTGHFDSSAQAEGDSSYFDITLNMEPIWEDEEEGKYLYVEQRVSTSDKPYRQRVYKVYEQQDGQFVSEIYLIENDSLFIGAWKNKTIFQSLKPEDLTKKEGCSVRLAYENGVFKGGTEFGKCISTFRGSIFATSDVEISSKGVVSLDRGWGPDSLQVWGPEGGAYKFLRKEN